MGVGSGSSCKIEGLGDRLHRGPEVDALGSTQVHRAGNADGKQHVVVEIERDLSGRHRRMHAKILRAEQALLFGGDSGKVDSVRRRLRGLRKGAGHLKQNAAAGAVVGSAVIDVVALGVGVDARDGRSARCRERHCRRMLAPATRAYDIRADIAAHAAFNMGAQADMEVRLGMESAVCRRVDGLVQVAESGQREQLLGHVVLNPAAARSVASGSPCRIALLDGLRVADHFPAVAGQIACDG